MSCLQDLQKTLQDPTIPYARVVIQIGLAVSLWELYINSRQRPRVDKKLAPTIPASIKLALPTLLQETYSKSQDYALAKLQTADVLGFFDTMESVILLTGFASLALPFLTYGDTNPEWTLLKGFWDIAARFPLVTGEITQSLAFVYILTTIGSILSIPKSYWNSFHLEQAHGFNNMTLSTFWIDQIKTYILTVVIELPLIAGMLAILQYIGPSGLVNVVAALMLFIFCIQLLVVPLQPFLIKIFNTLTPLERTSPVYPLVQALATRLKFPLKEIYIIDGSKRSSHSNAFFFGLPGFSKSIVLFDTLLVAEPEKVEAILAHELGHWAGNHVPVLLLNGLAQIGISLTVFVLFLNNGPLLSSFGFPTTSGDTNGPMIVSLLLAANLFAPLSALMKYGSNTLTRALEYNADSFAASLGYAEELKGALVHIHEKNLAIVDYDKLYSAYHHNHPTLIERLDSLDAELKKKA